MSNRHSTLFNALHTIATNGTDVNGREAGYTPNEMRTIAQKALDSHESECKAEDERYSSLMEIGKSSYAALAEMVAALNCDYDRLDKMRQDRADLVAAYEDAEDGKDAQELAALNAWDEENSEEYQALADAAGECTSREEAEQRIHEDALSVEVRGDWYSYGTTPDTPTEFKILLTTGGPAVQIIGELGEHGEPSRARLQVQDWFQPWTEYLDAESDVLLSYCRCFYFGE